MQPKAAESCRMQLSAALGGVVQPLRAFGKSAQSCTQLPSAEKQLHSAVFCNVRLHKALGPI
eukprot:1202940-Alexandrium_andersonii.AAC.1